MSYCFFRLVSFSGRRRTLWKQTTVFIIPGSFCLCETAAVFQPGANTSDQVAVQHHLSIHQSFHPDSSSVRAFSHFSGFNWDVWCLIWRGCRGGQGLWRNWCKSLPHTHKCVRVCLHRVQKWISNNPVSVRHSLTHLRANVPLLLRLHSAFYSVIDEICTEWTWRCLECFFQSLQWIF